jgi:Acyl dehydratase
VTKAIGSKSFTQADIDWFAMASGDYNPVHVDSVAARRLITGGTVVHGMRTLLWMLEQHFEVGGSGFSRLTAYFPRPVRPGEALQLRQSAIEGSGIRLELLRDGEMAAAVTLEGADVTPVCVEPVTGPPLRCAPDEHTFAALRGRSGQTAVAWRSADIQSAFPFTVRRLGEVRVAAIMALSRLVGMQAPGLHSIFTGLTIAFDEDHVGQIINWQVSRASAPVAPIRLTVSGGGLSGHLDAIVRPAPVEQPHMSALEAMVTEGEFAGQRAMVVGGSRGLGELVAKLIVAGGGESTISYRAGEADAQRIVSEITSWGGNCSAIPLDVADPDALAPSLGRLQQSPTHVYYFPTPRIIKLAASGFDAKAFIQYADIYVTAFDRLVLAMSEGRSEILRIFYPSTSFIDELPQGFAEYAAAKAAGEVHCAYLNRTLKPVAIQARRLSRLGTDQTASLIPQTVGSTLDVMLEAARSLHNFAKPSE